MLRIISIICLSILLISCGKNGNFKPEEPIRRNIIVLLDLSDRLILNPNQVYYDKETIKAIVDTYISTIKDTIIFYDKDFGVIKDKFSLRIANQKNMNVDRHYFEKKLQFDFANQNGDNTKFILKGFQAMLESQIDSLFKQATVNKNPKDYHGADIWGFMNEDLEHLIINEPMCKNYLFILTDGYIYFENYSGKLQNSSRRTDMNFLSNLRNKDWEAKFDKEDLGLIPINKKFNNLNVAVLQVVPKDFWNEYDLLKKVWSKWLNEMGINHNNILILKNSDEKLLKNKVQEFIQ